MTPSYGIRASLFKWVAEPGVWNHDSHLLWQPLFLQSFSCLFCVPGLFISLWFIYFFWHICFFVCVVIQQIPWNGKHFFTSPHRLSFLRKRVSSSSLYEMNWRNSYVLSFRGGGVGEGVPMGQFDFSCVPALEALRLGYCCFSMFILASIELKAVMNRQQ